MTDVKADSTPLTPLDEIVKHLQTFNSLKPPCVMVVNHTGTFYQRFDELAAARQSLHGHPDRFTLVFNAKGNPVFGRC